MEYKDLSETQKTAYQKCMEFLVNGKESFFVLNGYAGTGKTSIDSVINKTLKTNGFFNVANITLTGKASSVLKSKGIQATTVHKFMYTPIIDPDGNIIDFKRKDTDTISSIIDIIIVDEASMISKEIFMDLIGYGLPILFIGDIAQLPPISKENFNIMDVADWHLTEIHRQNSGNPIIQLASGIRENGTIDKKHIDENVIKTINKSDIDANFLKYNEFDIILCGTNKMREKINGLVRRSRGLSSDYAEVGERIICLKNNHFTETMNGEIFSVKSYLDFKTYKKYKLGKNIEVNIEEQNWYGVEPDLGNDMNFGIFDFAYCITVHKSQGSEFNNVLFIDEDVSRFCDRKKFRYTAITRAAKNLTIAR